MVLAIIRWMRNRWRITLFLTVTVIFIAVTCLKAQQAFAWLEPAMEHYLDSDRKNNVVQRLRTEEKRQANLMSEEDMKPVRIVFFEASPQQLGSHFYLSQFVAPEDLQSVQRENGKFLIPCLESDRLAYYVLRLKFGKPVLESLGHKVLSRATYYIEPVDHLAGFFAKFTAHRPGLDQKIEREVLVNDYIHTQLEELPPRLRKMTMDTFLGINLSFFGIPISIGYRSASAIRNVPEGVWPYSGHGLLGCGECVIDYAKKWSGEFNEEKAVATWKKRELLPKLAEHMAHAHHVLGVSLEDHTQNLEMNIKHRTGEILSISHRDFADGLLNPIPLIAEDRFPDNLDWKRVKLISMHPHYFSDQNTALAKDIWYHAAIYSGQGVTSHLSGFGRQQGYLLEFLELYLKETEKIVGEEIKLPEQAKEVLRRLEEKNIRENSGELQERSHLRNAMASVLKPVFEDIHRKKIAKIEAELRQAVTQDDQKALKKVFYKAMTAQKLVYMGVAERTQLLGEETKNSWLRSTIAAYLRFGFGKKKSLDAVEIKILNGKLFAVDIQTQKPLAMMIEPYQARGTGTGETSVMIADRSRSLVKSAGAFSGASASISCRSAHSGSGQ